MRYSIETTYYGCIEELTVEEETFIKRHKRTENGYKCTSDCFANQLYNHGFKKDFADRIYELYDDGFSALEFMEADEI